MSPGLRPLQALYRLNHRLVLNCLEGMDDATAIRRLSGGSNNVAFLAVHLIDARYFLLKLLGVDRPSPYAHLEEVRGVDDMESFPSVEELRDLWRQTGVLLDEALEGLGEAQLAAPSPQTFPLDDPTLAGAVAFLAQHEAYHVGQLALLRKEWGLGAMRYE